MEQKFRLKSIERCNRKKPELLLGICFFLSQIEVKERFHTHIPLLRPQTEQSKEDQEKEKDSPSQMRGFNHSPMESLWQYLSTTNSWMNIRISEVSSSSSTSFVIVLLWLAEFQYSVSRMGLIWKQVLTKGNRWINKPKWDCHIQDLFLTQRQRASKPTEPAIVLQHHPTSRRITSSVRYKFPHSRSSPNG